MNILRCCPRFHLGPGKGYSRKIFVLDGRGEEATKYSLMCSSLGEDIQTAEGSGADFLRGIAQIESGEVSSIAADGNAWVAHISKDKVWFEGLYSQGEGGEVSFEQYKLAVQTYVRFLADPQHRPIEIDFPD